MKVLTEGHLKTAKAMPHKRSYIQRRVIAAYYIAERRRSGCWRARHVHYYSQCITGEDAKHRIKYMDPQHLDGLDWKSRKRPTKIRQEGYPLLGETR